MPHGPVGAKLARESGMSANIHVECHDLFASKLRSYRDSVLHITESEPKETV